MSKKLLKGLVGAVLASVAIWGMSLSVMAMEEYDEHASEECTGAEYSYADGDYSESGESRGSHYHWKICSVCGDAFQEDHTIKWTYVDDSCCSPKCKVCGNLTFCAERNGEYPHKFNSGDNKCTRCGWVNPAIKVENNNCEQVEASKPAEESTPAVTQSSSNNIGVMQNEVRNTVDNIVKQMNSTGNISTNRSVTIETGNWYSFNRNTYLKLEELTKRGIPVSICFRYKGYNYCVTIPAGANVSELCDKSGWCGFCNLGSHYGFTLLGKDVNLGYGMKAN